MENYFAGNPQLVNPKTLQRGRVKLTLRNSCSPPVPLSFVPVGADDARRANGAVADGTQKLVNPAGMPMSFSSTPSWFGLPSQA